MKRRAFLDRTASLLRAAGVAEPRREARSILRHGEGVAPEALLLEPDAEIEPEDLARAEAVLDRRVRHEPLSRILGAREFWSLSFRITPAVLDPRPDSETLVAAVLARLAAKTGEGLRILDLGTGCGCLLLALLSELPQAQGLGIDLSPAAVALARQNAQDLGLASRATFQIGDWTDGLAGGWDLLVCNPPYIGAAELPGLLPEVRQHDPQMALSPGPDALAAYRRIIPAMPALLAPGGQVAFEVGIGQASAVAGLLRAAGLGKLETVDDLRGIARVVLARKQEDAPRQKINVGIPKKAI